MRYLALLCALVVSGCRQDVVVSGGTIHNGRVETVLILKIDVSACKDLPSYAQVDCVQSMISAFNNLANIANVLNLTPEVPNEAL